MTSYVIPTGPIIDGGIHLTVMAGLELEADSRSDELPISAELVETVLSKYLEDMEATITRQGYGLRELVQNFDAKPAEIKALFANQLDPIHASDLRDRMRLAGLPI